MSIHTLTSPDGARCQIHSNGGHVTSWIPAGGEERLFLSSRSAFGTGASIRGGVPVIFPQFNAWGLYARHGFARRSSWVFFGQGTDSDGRVWARFELRQSQTTLAEWPYAFHCTLIVLLGGRELEVRLRVENSGDDTFSFSAALHTYFNVTDIADARILGLEGERYLDAAAGGLYRVQQESELAFAAEVDRIYFAAPESLVLRDVGRSLAITQHGFSDTVVWNPGETKGGALNDLEPGGWRKFVCVESALIKPPVTLSPEADWTGGQRLRV